VAEEGRFRGSAVGGRGACDCEGGFDQLLGFLYEVGDVEHCFRRMYHRGKMAVQLFEESTGRPLHSREKSRRAFTVSAEGVR